MNDLKEVLSSITGKDYSKALEAIGYKVEAKKSEAVDDDDAIDNSGATDSDMQGGAKDLLDAAVVMGDLITHYESYLDSKLLPPILEAIDANIYDTGSAISAIYHYDSEWFRTTPVSARAKSKIASRLLSVCNNYYAFNMGLWTSLSKMDASILMTVLYKNKGS